MFTDAAVGAATESMLTGIDVPPIQMTEIQRKMEQPQRPVRSAPVFTRPAIAAAAVLIAALALPSIAPAVVQTVEAQYRAALQAMGGIAPPSPPQAFVAKLEPHTVTFAQAQAQVNFTLVAPEGLPWGATLSSIHIAPVGVFPKNGHAWRVAPPGVLFGYHRSDGREFVLNAVRYDPSNPPARYIFEAKPPDAQGRPVLAKHERFAWRNGDQLLTVIPDSDITAAEIASIQSAMHGVNVPRRELSAPSPNGDLFYRRIVKP